MFGWLKKSLGRERRDVAFKVLFGTASGSLAVT
jgi:hypothetical protein